MHRYCIKDRCKSKQDGSSNKSSSNDKAQLIKKRDARSMAKLMLDMYKKPIKLYVINVYMKTN